MSDSKSDEFSVFLPDTDIIKIENDEDETISINSDFEHIDYFDDNCSIIGSMVSISTEDMPNNEKDKVS